jgi:hypothetical protein
MLTRRDHQVSIAEEVEWFPWYKADWNACVAPRLTHLIRLLPHPLYDWVQHPRLRTVNAEDQVRLLTAERNAARRVIGRRENGWAIEWDGWDWWYVAGGDREPVPSDEIQAILAGRKGGS